MYPYLFAFLFIILSSVTHAFPCFVTVAKDSCWSAYNVSVNVLDNEGKVITTINIPKGESWGRASFNCSPAQTIAFNATFNPIFWENDKGKVFVGDKTRLLPQQINPQETAWNIPLCFPKNFNEVPLPPDASGNCQCMINNAPPIPPQ